MYKNNRGELVPKFATYKAERYGDVRVLLPYGNIVLSTQPAVARMRSQLQHFSDTDYLLPTGDPVIIGLATAIAAGFNNGRVNLLRWDRNENEYIVVRADTGGGAID
jgi:hypothetical protein